jgi:hypothetical protein
LPCDRKRKLEFNIVESVNIEILIADKKIANIRGI